jgi:hypothetical protein
MDCHITPPEQWRRGKAQPQRARRKLAGIGLAAGISPVFCAVVVRVRAGRAVFWQDETQDGLVRQRQLRFRRFGIADGVEGGQELPQSQQPQDEQGDGKLQQGKAAFRGQRTVIFAAASPPVADGRDSSKAEGKDDHARPRHREERGGAAIHAAVGFPETARRRPGPRGLPRA